jgi:hypothetical protein
VKNSTEVRAVRTRYRIDARTPRSGITASSHCGRRGSCRRDRRGGWGRIAPDRTNITVVGSHFRWWTNTATQTTRIDDQLPAVCHRAPAISARARTRIRCGRCTGGGSRGGITSAITAGWRRTAPRGRCSGGDRGRGTGNVTALTASAHIRRRHAVAIAAATPIGHDMPAPSISHT